MSDFETNPIGTLDALRRAVEVLERAQECVIQNAPISSTTLFIIESRISIAITEARKILGKTP